MIASLRNRASAPDGTTMISPTESTSVRPWRSDEPPQRVLIIRFHAVGDVAISLASCAAFRRKFPDSQIDFLTMDPTALLAASLDLFTAVHTFPLCDSKWERLRYAIAWAARLRRYRYQIVLDLQRNWVTRFLRRSAAPTAWAEFDRFSPRLAGLRTLDTFHRIGFDDLELDFRVPVRAEALEAARQTLRSNGWNESMPLVVLNPAGLWTTRNWPLECYGDFARMWLKDEDTTFLLIGTDRLSEKARFLSDVLGSKVVNLVGRTSLAEANAILQHVSFVLSEDSGLMHMAWVSGIPTLALFGSSRHDWSAPLGPHTQCLHSGDLPCAACMSATCRYGDTHCLTRHTPDTVYGLARQLMRNCYAKTDRS